MAEFVYIAKSLKIPKGGGVQNQKIEEKTTQWPKEKGQTTTCVSAKHTIKLKTIDVFIGSCVVL